MKNVLNYLIRKKEFCFPYTFGLYSDNGGGKRATSIYHFLETTLRFCDQFGFAKLGFGCKC